MDLRQEILDRFYWEHGKCCAGCDHWRHISALIGDCTRSAPVSGADRASMLGIVKASYRFESGHVVTQRDHVCGEFRDDFDWSVLPIPYRKRVGAPV